MIPNILADFPLIFLSWVLFFVWQLVGFSWLYRFYAKKTVDAAWGFGRLATWLVLSFVIWTIAHLGLPANQPAIVFLLLALTSLHASVYYAQKKGEILSFFKRNWRVLLVQELLFLLFFVFLCVVRGFQPRVEGLEKFMDIGLMAGYLRSPTLPAEDMWLAGEKINYYTFGHFMGAIATQMLGVKVEVAYNLILGLIMGVVSIQAASLAANLALMVESLKKTKQQLSAPALKAAIVGGVLLVLAGNGHASWHLLKNSSFEGYWYPDATRFIENTIHEFPAYSFIVSDLHAHVWGLPVVLFLILNIYVWAQTVFQHAETSSRSRKKSCSLSSISKIFQSISDQTFTSTCSWLKRVVAETHVQVSMIVGWLLGVAIITSTWDFLVYSLLLTVVGVLIFLFKKSALPVLFSSALIMILMALVTASSWLLNFDSISEGAAWVQERSPLWQLAVLWLPHLLLSMVAAATALQLILKNKRKPSSRELMIIGMVLTSIILLLLPEIMYVKDIYPNHPRANTMFKLTFQAFTIMTTVIASFVGMLGTQQLKKVIPVIQQLSSKILLTIFFLVVGYYAYFGYRDFYGGLKQYRSLDGLEWLMLESPSDYQGIIWLRENIAGRPVVLEAVGESYTTFARVSTFTGLPTVLGWRVHQWLWRGGFDIPSQRTNEVKVIYEQPLSIESQQLLNHYLVSYIFLGNKEREAYQNLDEEGLLTLGEVVFSQNGTLIIRLQK